MTGVRCVSLAPHERGETDSSGTQLEKLSGQHHLLRWRLTPSVIDFLTKTHSVLDIDEYG